MTDLQDQRVLVAATAGHRFALPLEIVIEILRPLPVHPLGNLPPYVRGVSIIRGEPTPVLDLARLFGEEQAAVGRFVALRLEQRRVALAVESVVGLQNLSMAGLASIPELLQQAQPEMLRSLGVADGKLLVVLGRAFVVPPEVWSQLARPHAPLD